MERIVSEFSNLTVIVPTYGDRHGFVARTATHWSNTDARLIVVDESRTCMPLAQQALLPSLASYHHVPSLLYLERLQHAIEIAETEFVVICPDDNFLVQATARKCITTLDANSDLLACSGIYCWFSRFGNMVTCLENLSDLSQSQGRSNDRRERLIASCHSIFFYGVMRRSAMQACLRMLAPRYSAASVGFHVVQFGLAYLGNWDSVRELMWFRSYEGEDRFASSRGIDRAVTFHSWYTEPAYALEVEGALSRMASLLAQETHAAEPDIRLALRDVCEYNSELSRIQSAAEQKKPAVWRRGLAAVLPPSAKNLARRVKHRLVPDGIPLSRHLEWLREHDVAIDDKGVADIERAILSSVAG